MPWWFALYLAAFALMGVAGIVDDLRSRRPRWFVPLDALSLSVSLLLLVGFWRPSIAVALGRWALPLAALVVLGEGYNGLADIRAAPAEHPDLGDRGRRRAVAAAAAVVALTVLPVAIVGVLITLRAA